MCGDEGQHPSSHNYDLQEPPEDTSLYHMIVSLTNCAYAGRLCTKAEQG